MNIKHPKNTKSKSKIKLALYRFLTFIILNQQNSLILQIILTFFQLLQIISFSFDKKYFKYWRNEVLTSHISHFLKYSRISPFFIGNFTLYAIGFFLACLIFITYISIIIFASIALTTPHSKRKLSFLFTFINSTFNLFLYLLYTPMFCFFITPLNCVDGYSAFASEFKCSGATYYAILVIGIVFALLLFITVFFGYLLGYEQIYNKYNISSKQSSKADMMLLICKTVISICHVVLKDDISFVVLYLIIGITIAVIYYKNANYYNEKMNKLNLSLSFIVGLNCISLFIARITYNTTFNGCLFIFLVGIPVILITIWFYYEGIVTINSSNKYANAKEGYIVIVKLIDVIKDASQNDRKARILLESYVYNYELTCTIPNCPLSQYTEQISQCNYNVYSLLYQHINVRYKKLIHLFPNEPFIKLMYAYFLFNSLNKTNLAMHQLSSALNQRLSLDEDFLAYRLDIMFDKENSHIFENPDNLSYANLFQKFKTQITKISSLYMSFWTTLYLSHHNSNEDLSKLNDCGSAIEKTKHEIDSTFNELQLLKPQDIIVIKYYADYLSEIMNEKEKSQTYKTRIKEIKESQTEDYTKDIIDIDLKNISSDEIQYIIISTSHQDFGTMLNVSLGLCVEIGYTKDELIGKHLNMLLPEIMRNYHNELLKRKYMEFFQNEVDAKNNHKKQYKTFLSFYLNKSYFIVPAIFSPGVINTDTNDTLFITKVCHVQSNYSFTHNDKNKKECYVLINTNYIIQNFTVEALKLLALSSDEFSKKQMSRFIGNYIVDFKYRMFDKKNEQEFKLKWTKKVNDVNFSCEFTCINTPLVINNNYIGHFLHFIINDNRYAITSGAATPGEKFNLNHNFIPTSIPNERFVYDIDKNTFSINNNKHGLLKGDSSSHNNNNNNNNDNASKTLVEKLKEKALSHLKHIHNGNSSELNRSHIHTSTSKDDSQSEDDDDDDDDEVNNINSSECESSSTSGYENGMNTNNTNTHKLQSTTQHNEDEQDSLDFALQMLKKQDEFNQKLKHNNNNNDIYSGYYVVKTQKIKYLIYNFNTLHFDEETSPEYFMNYVLYRLKELSEPQVIRKRSKKRNKSRIETNQIENYLNKRNTNQVDNKIMKQIQYSLEKYEAHGSMIKLRLISFITFLLLIGEGVFLLIYYSNIYSALKENCSLIHDSYNLLLNCAYSIFFTRELVLLAIPKYDITYQNKEAYHEETLTALKELSTQSQNYTNKILTTSASLSKEHELMLYNTTFKLLMMTDELDILTFNATLNAALSQTLSAVFILSYMNSNELIPISKTPFFSLYNNINAIYDGLVHQASIFSSELSRVSNIHMKILIISIVVFICIGIVSTYLVSKYYFHVVNTKNNYLEVFYEISIDIIKFSLERCENFNQRFLFIGDTDMKVNINETQSNDDQSDSESIIDYNLMQQQKLTSNTSSPNDKDNTNSNVHIHHHKKQENTDTFNIIIRIIIFICLQVSTIFSSIIISITKHNLNFFNTNINVYRAIGDVNVKYLMLFNAVREYLFDKDAHVRYEWLNDYIEREFNDIYTNKLKAFSVVTKNINLLGNDFKKIYFKLYYNDICEYGKTFFETTATDKSITCDYVSGDTARYGLSVLIPYFIDEIKELKFYYEIAQQLAIPYGFVYNYTLYGFKEFNSSIDLSTDERVAMYNLYDPMTLLSSQKHDRILIIFKYILKKVFAEMSKSLIGSNEDKQRSLKEINNSLLIAYFCLCGILYFVVWIKIENTVYSTIFKAKNMLMILPKEILIGLDSVYKLFDISNTINEEEEEESENEE